MSLVPEETLAETMDTVPLPDGGVDQSIAEDKLRAQFCADVPDETATLMAVAQRPITEAALSEPRETTHSSWPSGRTRRVPRRFPADPTPSGVSHAKETAEMIVQAAVCPTTGAARPPTAERIGSWMSGALRP